MDKSLKKFFDLFEASFAPPRRSRGANGKRWWIFKPWGDYLRNVWLPTHFNYLGLGKAPRHAEVHWKEPNEQASDYEFDYAIAWQFDNNKAYETFASLDFIKLLDFEDAACRIAIVQNRTHGRSGSTKANELLERLRAICVQRKKLGERPVGYIDIRRTHHTATDVKFSFTGYDLNSTRPLKLINLGGEEFSA